MFGFLTLGQKALDSQNVVRWIISDVKLYMLLVQNWSSLHCVLASCGAVYCNWSCLWVCVCVCGFVCGSVTTITLNWEGGLWQGENFWLRLTTASVQCLRLSEHFFIVD